MTITYSPSNFEVTEFIGTPSTTVTLSSEENASIYIESVSCSEQVSDLIITNDETSFTFSSTFQDMFPRVVKFTMQDSGGRKSFGSVSRFIDLPPTYKGVYQYVPPNAEFKDLIFNISLYYYSDETLQTPPWDMESPIGNPLYDEYKVTATWTLVVRQNWQASIQALKTSITSGSGYAEAVARYPELEL
jgi:hypothetical protein